MVANSSFPVAEMLTFSKQFTHSTSNPPTLLTILNPANDRHPTQNNTLSNQAQKTYGDQGLRIKTRVGLPVKEVLAEIKDGDYNMVIVGDRSKHTLVHKFRSSIAIKIAEVSPCPVMVLKGKTGLIKHVLLCDSGAEKSKLVNNFLLQIIDLLGKEVKVTVLHVMSQISAGPGIRGKQLRADAEELILTHTPEGDLLERDLDILGKSGVNSTPKIRHGLVVDEILAETQSGDYDLVVIGSNQELWQQFLLDDLTHKIIQLISLPILVIK